MLFEFPFNLIGKSTMAFSTGQSLRVLKSWYTAGGPEGGFRRSLADGLNQRVVSSVAQARSLVEQAFPYWRLSTNTRQRFTAQHSTNTFHSSFSSTRLSGKHSCHFRHLLEANFYAGNFRWIVSREGVRGKTLNVALKQPLGLRDSTSAILRSTRKYNWARVLDLVTCTRCLSCYCLLVDLLECLTFARVWWFKVYRPSYFRRQQ